MKVQPFKSLGSLPLDIDLTLQAGAAYTYLGTKLVASKTHHFSRANTKALAEEVDKILAVEIKKTLATILANEESEASAIAKEAALHVGKTSLKKIAKATKDDLKAIGKSALNELRQGNGFEYLAAGFATGGVGLIAGKAVYDAYLRRKDGKLDGQIHDLRLALGDKFLALSDAEQTGAKGKGLRKAMERLTELRDAFLHERMFGGGSNPDAGDVPVVNDALLSRTDQTALTLTSNEYGGNLAATGKVNLGPMDTTAKKTADLMGQKLDFRFQVRGANDMIMVQDTHANFMQMTTKLAISGALATTGVKKLDAKLKKNHAPAAVQTPGAPALFGGRRFGALRYRAATVYMKNDGAHKRTAVPGISGVSMGVSVRAARLVSYAQNVKALIKSDSPDNDIKEFETWVCLHLGCKPLQLREFIAGTLLPDCEIGEDGKTTFTSDALLLEINYGLQKKDLVEMTMDPDGAPPDLFAHMSYHNPLTFQNDVAADKYKMSSMRLRYRVQTPLKDTAKTFFSLGLPLGEHSPLAVNLDFGSNKEVGQESIVDLATWFSPEIQAAAQSEAEKNEMSVPPVVLFNRC